MSGWFGGGSDAGTSGEQVFYAAVGSVDVRVEADSSSKVVGKLRLHERVARSKEKRGYSFVRARGGSLEGWVLSSKLDWRAPRASGAAPTATTPVTEDSSGDASAPVAGDDSMNATADPSAAEVAPAEAETVEATEPVPTVPAPAAPEPASKKKGMGASVFDPY